MLSLLMAVVVTSTPVSVEEEADCEPVPLLAAVLLPGARVGDGLSWAGSGYVEVRPFDWVSLRSGGEFSKQGYAIDFLGLKLSPLARARFRPYLAAAVSGDFPADREGQSYLGFAGAAGLDVSLASGFFLSAEGRVRVFRGTGLQGGAFAGLGFEFF